MIRADNVLTLGPECAHNVYMETTTRPTIFTNLDDIDFLTGYEHITVAAGNLKEGMVLVDELGCPTVVIDHKQRGRQGDACYFVWNIDTNGKWSMESHWWISAKAIVPVATVAM